MIDSDTAQSHAGKPNLIRQPLQDADSPLWLVMPFPGRKDARHEAGSRQRTPPPAIRMAGTTDAVPGDPDPHRTEERSSLAVSGWRPDVRGRTSPPFPITGTMETAP